MDQTERRHSRYHIESIMVSAIVVISWEKAPYAYSVDGNPRSTANKCQANDAIGIGSETNDTSEAFSQDILKIEINGLEVRTHFF